MDTTKAHVVVCAMPFISHVTPMKTIAQHLLALNYQVTFITSSFFRSIIERTGAAFVEPSGWEDFHDDNTEELLKGAPNEVVARANWTVTEFFVKTIPAQREAIEKVVDTSQATNPNRPVILLPESSFAGGLPGLLGAPGLNTKGVLAVGIFPILAISIDTAPSSSGALPDSSLEGRKRNQELNKTFVDLWSPMQGALNDTLQSLGARKIDTYRHNAIMSHSTLFLQLCPPSLEYPRSDAPPTLRFTGGLPRNVIDPTIASELPCWWDEIVQNPSKKRIVAVSQGTMVLNYTDLIIPTISALADLPNILVVVALGKKGATLPSAIVTPPNTRIADWIPFDALLPLTDVFVSNGGYGSFQNALSRGVPLVVAGPLFADKKDIADRVEWSGTGISLKTGQPSVESLREAVLEVLENGKYRNRVREVQREIERYDPMGIIAGAIDEVAAS